MNKTLRFLLFCTPLIGGAESLVFAGATFSRNVERFAKTAEGLQQTNKTIQQTLFGNNYGKDYHRGYKDAITTASVVLGAGYAAKTIMNNNSETDQEHGFVPSELVEQNSNNIMHAFDLPKSTDNLDNLSEKPLKKSSINIFLVGNSYDNLHAKENKSYQKGFDDGRRWGVGIGIQSQKNHQSAEIFHMLKNIVDNPTGRTPTIAPKK